MRRGDKHCSFCYAQQTFQHLFFECHVAQFVWRRVFFVFNIPPAHPITPKTFSVIFISSYWLHFWSTMLPQEEQDTMRNGAILLESVAKGLLFHYGWRSSIRIAS
uniref:Reverse transcriptase zinc-binding domain-containing protein n=1 Tax=Oryza nivara TaxID=4536 RepID=A0A0E0GX06_ORYNI